MNLFLFCKLVHLYHFFLDSTYKGCHVIFLLLWLTSLNMTLWVHPCCCKWHYFILFDSWVIFHCWLIGKDSDAGRDWGQEEEGTTEDEMAGWHHWLDGRESEWTPGVGDGQGGLECCDSWGYKESDTTEWLIWSLLWYMCHIFIHPSVLTWFIKVSGWHQHPWNPSIFLG